MCTCWNWGAQTGWNRVQDEIDEHRSRRRRAEGNLTALILAQLRHRGVIKLSARVRFMSEVASGVIFITGDGHNLVWYSPLDNITVAFVPLAYSESTKWIAAAASTKVCGVRGSNNRDVVGFRPKLLAVKKNWWRIRSSPSIWVNHEFLSSMTLARYASSIRSSLTWIWTSVS